MSIAATGKIDVTKINNDHLYKGKSGTYLDFVLFENDDGPDQFGFTHRIVQSVSKEAREAGVKGRIVGNLKLGPIERAQNPAGGRTKPAPKQDDDSDSLPF